MSLGVSRLHGYVTDMGLDIIEFVIAVEGTFGIDIPDADAVHLETPRQLIDYISDHVLLDVTAPNVCLSQRAFYRSRAAITRRFGVQRGLLRPHTRLRDVLGNRRDEWKALGRDVGATIWPRLRSESRVFTALGGVATLGELAQDLATYDVAALRGHATAWTRQEIEVVVLGLIERELSVDMSRYTLDSRFVRDMGCG